MQENIIPFHSSPKNVISLTTVCNVKSSFSQLSSKALYGNLSSAPLQLLNVHVNVHVLVVFLTGELLAIVTDVSNLR